MGLQGILFYFIAALFYFISFYICGRLKRTHQI